MKVVHISSAHPAFDNRIFHKECRSLVEAGFEVVLIVPHTKDTTVDGVRIRSVPMPGNRFQRFTRTTRAIYKAALKEDGDLYHFHDPDLAITGLKLRMRGKPVIYDVHEDYYTSIKTKAYINPLLRQLLATGAAFFEKLFSRFFHIVRAERYYAKRFPSGVDVLNYPDTRCFEGIAPYQPNCDRRIRLLYTGYISPARGAFQHANIVNLLPNVEVHMIGRCTENTANKIVDLVGANRDRLFLSDIGKQVPFNDILRKYQEGNWAAGLAVFPSHPHYLNKELTKFFEYMACGIPIICSDFPAWRSLVRNNGLGFCVDPADPAELVRVIEMIASDSSNVVRISQRAKQAVAERFNWEGEARSLVDMYNQILKR